jgi:hypothetical protein
MTGTSFVRIGLTDIVGLCLYAALLGALCR